MPKMHYELFAGDEKEAQQRISLEASKETGKPILLTAASGPDGFRVFVVFEKPVR